MAIELKSPSTIEPARERRSIFLGGGITGCPDWQSTLVGLLRQCDVTLINPRRDDFDVCDPSMSVGQIRWEFDRLHSADAVLFWFPMETLCPITLFELGTVLVGSKPVIVGCHPGYKRRFDLEIQVPLYRPGTLIHSSLEALSGAVEAFSVQ